MDKKTFWVLITSVFCVFIILLTLIVFAHKQTVTKMEAQKELQIIQETSNVERDKLRAASEVERNKVKEESKVERSKIHSKWLPWNKD